MMVVVYNSEQFTVVAWPVEDAYEVVDKAAGRGSFFRGDIAHRFRDGIRVAVAEDPSSDTVDDFIANFGLELTNPLHYH